MNDTYKQLDATAETNAFASVTGCYATAEDMTKLIREVICGTKLLTDGLKHQLIAGNRNHWLPQDQRGSSYGLGIMSHEIANQTILGHSGAFLTHRSATYTNRATGITVAVMSTSKQVPVNEVLIGIFEVLDYFATHASPQPTHNECFTTMLQNLMIEQYILGLRKGAVGVHLDDWHPFEQIEELEVVNDDTLRVVQTHDFRAEGELVQYTFSTDNKVQAVRYAGTSMWPQAAFTEWLEASDSATNLKTQGKPGF